MSIAYRCSMRCGSKSIFEIIRGPMLTVFCIGNLSRAGLQELTGFALNAEMTILSIMMTLMHLTLKLRKNM